MTTRYGCDNSEKKESKMSFSSEKSNALETGLLPVVAPDSGEEVEKPDREMRRKLIAEFTGTAILAACISLRAGAVAIGFCLVALVFTFGHVSGGMFNPAVSFAVFLRGRMSLKIAGLYSLVQIAGAFIGGLFTLAVSKTVNAPEVLMPGFPMPNKDILGDPLLATFLCEFLGSFVLATVVLNVATTAANEDNPFYGIAIGFTVGQGAFTVGGISGAAFNPAIGIALPLIFGKADWYICMYLVGPLLGAALAAGVFRFTAAPADLKDSRIHLN